jgi:hypothetical protein
MGCKIKETKRRLSSSVMLCHVALVRTDISEEHITSIIRVTIISKLGTMLAITSKQGMLQGTDSYKSHMA